MKICNIEGCNNSVFAKGKCKFHQERKPLKRGFLKLKKLKTKPKKVNIDEINQNSLFFKQIWLERPHYSEISGEPLGNQINSTYFHHIILKSDKLYGSLGKYDSENIILLTTNEHSQVHVDMYRYEKINQKREYLLNKYQKLLDEKESV